MPNDLIAEMQGLREELAAYTRRGQTDRAGQVRERMEEVRAEGARRAGVLSGEAERFDAAGQHALAGSRRDRAAALLAGLGVDVDLEDAADSTPRETVVPKRRGGRPRKESD